jgi:hypothetical protein
MRVVKQIRGLLLIGLLMVFMSPAAAWAAQSASANYQVNEVFFGSGGVLNDCSATYCAKESAGETTVGNTASTNYQAQGGFNTDRQPYIQMSVNSSAINLGTLSTNSTATATATFTVEAYLAHGYSVSNASPPPTNGSYTMATSSVPSASQTGAEQFGINLVANTTPTSFGANPTYQPDASFSFGQVNASYSTPNEYKYSQGDVIALSTKSTSQTTYTISYIFNISHTTPGGTYTFNHVLVATATY